jgi:hypothetical protein
MFKCKICRQEFKNLKGLSVHIYSKHKINLQKYYNTYIKVSNEEYCNNENCNNKTNFNNLRDGYCKYCSLVCANTSEVRKNQERNRMIKKYKNPNERKRTGSYVKKAFKKSEKRKNVSIGVLESHQRDPTIKERISIGIKNVYQNKPELRKKASEHGKRIWKDPKIREKIINSLQKTCSTKSYKEKKRKIALEIAKDPIWRKNVSEGTKKGQSKNPNFRESRRQYMLDGGAAYCNRFIKNPSKPQIALFKLCQEVLPYPILNYPCLGYSIDIVVPQLSLAIEYDGSYWHQDKDYDIKRQKELEEEGWNFLRYIDYIPSKKKLRQQVLDII